MNNHKNMTRIEIDNVEHWLDLDTGEIVRPVKFLADYETKEETTETNEQTETTKETKTMTS